MSLTVSDQLEFALACENDSEGPDWPYDLLRDALLEIHNLESRLERAVVALQKAPDINLDAPSKNQIRHLVQAAGIAWHELTYGRYPESARGGERTFIT